MSKRLISLFCVLILVLMSTVCAGASASDEEKLNCLYDYEDLLTESEEVELEAMLSELSTELEFTVAIVTTEDFDNKDSQAFTDDFYDYNNFGYGNNNDGVLLAISEYNGEAHISTTGYGEEAFTEDGINYIIDQIRSDLTDGNYYEAFTEFSELCEDFVLQANTGDPFDSSNLPRSPYPMMCILVSIVIGVIIAFIIVSVMKGKLKTVVRKANAHDYMRQGSLEIYDSKDIFLYRNVIKKYKPKNKDSNTHVGSSGTSHGGKTFKF